MLRYSGEVLTERANIIVIGSNKVGNYIVALPLLSQLRQAFPSANISYIGSRITEDLESACDLIDHRLSWDDHQINSPQELCTIYTNHVSTKPVDLCINLDNFNLFTVTLVSLFNPVFFVGNAHVPGTNRPFPPGELPQHLMLQDDDWDSPAFLARYTPLLRSNYISEIFCCMSFLPYVPYVTPLPSRPPSFDVPDILIHCNSTRQAKVLHSTAWFQIIDHLHHLGLTIGLIGTLNSCLSHDHPESLVAHHPFVRDLRGQTSLLELSGAAQACKLFITVDAGPFHISASSNVPTYLIVGNDANSVGASPLNLWVPPRTNVTRSVCRRTCALCQLNHFKNSDCISPTHDCMISIDIDHIIDWINSNLEL